MDLKIKCGGYVSSIRNPDGTELLRRPVHNKWLDWGMQLITIGGALDNDGWPLYDLSDRAQFFSTYGMFLGARIDLGTGSAPSTIDMTGLQTTTDTNALCSVTVPVVELTAAGTLHFRLTIAFSTTVYTFREFGLRRGSYNDSSNTNLAKLLFRVVLDEPITTANGTKIDYDFYMTLPYFTRTVVANLFGTGLPGEVWLRPAYTATKNNLVQGSSNESLKAAGTFANATSPQGLMTHAYIKAPTGIYEKPMFSSSTTEDFPADGVGDAALPITCASAAYSWVSHDLVNYVATLKYVVPASAGAMSIAYGNVRGLAFRFGSYDSSGAWVGQTLNKTASQKLNIQLTYSFSSM